MLAEKQNCEICAAIDVKPALICASQHTEKHHHVPELISCTLQLRAHLQPSHVEAEHLSSQYLCGASIPDTSHITVEIEVSNPTSARLITRTVKALIDSGASANFISPRLSKRLKLHTEKANTAISGLNCKALCAAGSSEQCNFTVSSRGALNHLTPSSVTALVVGMEAYDLV